MGPHFLGLDVALDFQGLPLRGRRAVEAATLPKDPLRPQIQRWRQTNSSKTHPLRTN